MAKNSITDYSKTAASNTDIQSVDIDEGCLPSGINNAIRELMADLAEMNDGTVSLTSPSFAAASLTGNLSFGDGNKAIFGASSDLQIYHTGSDSVIQDAGQGDLYIKASNNFWFQGNTSNDIMARFQDNGAVTLYYDNSAKLATTSTGIDVTGTVTADGLTVDGTTSFTQKVVFDNNDELRWKDSGGTERTALYLDSSNNLNLGTSAGGNLRFINGSSYTERARLDASGNLLVGKTTNTLATAGISLRGDVDVIQTTRSNGDALNVNRLASDGSLIGLYKDTVAVGSIGSAIGNAYFAGSSTGITFGSANVYPTNASGTKSDNALTLGSSSNRFDDLYLGGTAYASSAVIEGSSGLGNTEATLQVRSTETMAAGTGGTISLMGDDGTGTQRTFGMIKGAKGNASSGAFGGGLEFYSRTNGVGDAVRRMIIDQQGRVGIGTSAPDKTLVVSSSSGTEIVINDSDATPNPILRFRESGSTSSTISTSSNNLIFSVPTSERMRIDSAGRVGIGTSSPNRELHVSGLATVENTAGNGAFLIYPDSAVNKIYSRAGNATSTSLPFAIHMGSTERIRIDNSGNVGIGNSSPTYKLDVLDNSSGSVITRIKNSNAGTGARAGIFLDNDGGNLMSLYATSSTYTGVSSWTDAGVISTSSTAAGGLIFNSQSSGGIKFQTSLAERMRIDSSGRLLVGTTSSANTAAGLRLKNSSPTSGNFSDAIASGGGHIEMCKGGNGNQGFMNCNFISSTGTGIIGFQNFAVDKGSIRWNSSGTSYNTTSDYRLKENVTAITDGLERVKQLNPSRFNFISDPEKTVDGFLAHEAQTVVPEAITGTHNEVETWTQDLIDAGEAPANTLAGDNKLDDDGNTIPVYQNIDQSKLVPLLTAALKEAITKIEDLEARVATLEGN